MSQQRSVGVARRLVMALLGHQVTDAVLAPGSRSGPIALALHAADAQGLIRLHVRVDEREAGFLALGLAKASGRLTPVVTTSGTAVANLHPAMLEALHAQLPLLAVTADRPARLRGTGANQTTVQPGIFPGVPFTDRVNGLLSAVGAGGPAHLNLEFDEPLIEPMTWDFPQNLGIGFFTEPDEVATLTDDLRTVVVAGDGADPALARLAAEAGWPILAEPSSGLRGAPTAIAAERVVAAGPLAAQVERIVSTGHATLSRPITRLLARADVEIVHLGDASTFPVEARKNVTFVGGVVVEAAAIDGADSSWLNSWRAAGERVLATLPDAEPFTVARAVWSSADLLVVGSSNPIRDLDLVAPVGVAGPRVLANRGLAGIDGTVSTAVGAALAGGGRAIALMGDLTFLHGANGLLIGPDEPRPDLTVVVLNDDGGGIFHGLEQGAPEYVDAFERVYATPTGTRIDLLCAAHGVPHRLVEAADLASALATAAVGIEVCEIPASRADRRTTADLVAALANL